MPDRDVLPYRSAEIRNVAAPPDRRDAGARARPVASRWSSSLPLSSARRGRRWCRRSSTRAMAERPAGRTPGDTRSRRRARRARPRLGVHGERWPHRRSAAGQKSRSMAEPRDARAPRGAAARQPPDGVSRDSIYTERCHEFSAHSSVFRGGFAHAFSSTFVKAHGASPRARSRCSWSFSRAPPARRRAASAVRSRTKAGSRSRARRSPLTTRARRRAASRPPPTTRGDSRSSDCEAGSGRSLRRRPASRRSRAS